jgi:hypothetical protein
MHVYHSIMLVQGGCKSCIFDAIGIDMNSRSSADADNFLSATTPGVGQYSIEAELDKHGGKNFGPPNGKKMTI